MQTKQRNCAMDVIRCTALFCVIAVHFFLNNGYYDEVVTGIRMYFMTFIRSNLMICVPLFLILSGYLLKNRMPVRSYYAKLTKTLGIYVLACFACLAYGWIFQNKPVSIVGTVEGILGFWSAPYAWYVEMYIGLFLIIPFLNVMYNSLPDLKTKKLLILVMLILTALPSVINIYNFFLPGWWAMPSINTNVYQLIPDWWVGIYPITYYLIGCYLREYPLKMKRSANLIGIALTAVGIGLFNIYFSRQAVFNYGPWAEYRSLLTVISSVLVFNYLAQGNYSRVSPRTGRLLAKLSDWSLGAYLVSWIFDQAFYKILNQWEPIMQKRLEYFLIIVPAVYICSSLLSGLLNAIYQAIDKGIRGLIRKKRKNPI